MILSNEVALFKTLGILGVDTFVCNKVALFVISGIWWKLKLCWSDWLIWKFSKKILENKKNLTLDRTLTTIIVNLCTFLTAMTFDRSHVKFYMTEFSFLTAFFSVCVCATKTPYLLLASMWRHCSSDAAS